MLEFGGWLTALGAVSCSYASGVMENSPRHTTSHVLSRVALFIASIPLGVAAYSMLQPMNSLWIWGTLCTAIPSVIGGFWGPVIHKRLGLSRPEPEA